MNTVVWSPKAEADLKEIWQFIASDNPSAADALLMRLFDRAQLAATQPNMGVARPELSATARLLFEGRYVLIYEPLTDGILIVAIVHGMRDESNWL